MQSENAFTDLKDVFNHLDKDRDGCISVEDLSSFIEIDSNLDIPSLLTYAQFEELMNHLTISPNRSFSLSDRDEDSEGEPDFLPKNQMEEMMESMQTENAKLENENKQLKQQAKISAEQSQKIKQLHNEIEKLKSEISTLQASEDNLAKENRNLKLQQKKNEEEKAVINNKKDIETREARIEEQNKKIDSLTQENLRLEQELSKTRSTNRDYQDRAEGREKELNELKVKLEAQSKEFQDKFKISKKTIKDLNTKLSELEEQLALSSRRGSDPVSPNFLSEVSTMIDEMTPRGLTDEQQQKTNNEQDNKKRMLEKEIENLQHDIQKEKKKMEKFQTSTQKKEELEEELKQTRARLLKLGASLQRQREMQVKQDILAILLDRLQQRDKILSTANNIHNNSANTSEGTDRVATTNEDNVKQAANEVKKQIEDKIFAAIQDEATKSRASPLPFKVYSGLVFVLFLVFIALTIARSFRSSINPVT